MRKKIGRPRKFPSGWRHVATKVPRATWIATRRVVAARRKEQARVVTISEVLREAIDKAFPPHEIMGVNQ